MNNVDYDDDFDGRPSKSQLKRDMNALQELGEKLAELPPDVLKRMPLDDDALLQALLQVQQMPAREARRRHFQLIGKLMRRVDADAVRAAYERTQSNSIHAQQRLHLLERWRARIVAEGDACLGEAMAVFPLMEPQQVRQLIREIKREESQGKPPAAARKLFQYLKAHLPEDE